MSLKLQNLKLQNQLVPITRLNSTSKHHRELVKPNRCCPSCSEEESNKVAIQLSWR